MQLPNLNGLGRLIGEHVRDNNHFGINGYTFFFPQQVKGTLKGFFRVIAEGDSVRIKGAVQGQAPTGLTVVGKGKNWQYARADAFMSLLMP